MTFIRRRLYRCHNGEHVQWLIIQHDLEAFRRIHSADLNSWIIKGARP